jgi:hypothetical protein
MNSGWPRETKVAIVCVALLPWWIWVTGLNLQSFWIVVFAVIVGVGSGCAIAGLRRGSRTNRWAAGLCLVVLVVAGVGFTVLVRLDLWLNP